MLRTSGVKFFADDVIEAKTVWMIEPYAGSSDESGIPNCALAAFKRMVRTADILG